jgi:prevent-host-death family protein
MSTTHINMQDARVKFAELILRVRYKNESFVIKKQGVPVALVIPIENIPTLAPPPETPTGGEQLPISPMSNLKVFETAR